MKKLFIPFILIGLLFSGCTEESSLQNKSVEVKQIKPTAVDAPLAVSGSEIEKVSKNNYVLIFDDSGSMSEVDKSGEVKFESAKKAVSIFLNTLTENDNIHFVTLNQGVVNGLSNIKKVLNNLSNRGGTPLDKALDYSLSYLDELATTNKGYGNYTIISITDGESDGDTNYVLNRILSYKKADIVIKTIGFNMPENNPLNSNKVDYYSATNFESLKNVLLSIKAESESFTDNSTQF